MAGEPDPHLTLIERLDLALALRAARDAAALHDPTDGDWQPAWLRPDPAADGLWVAGTLGLRGLVVDPREATEILQGGAGRFAAEQHELHLVRGMGRVLEMVRERAAAARPPDGWFAIELFRTLTAGVPRFRNNAMRRDEPWDAIPTLVYPAAEELPELLDGLRLERNYGDAVALDEMHPVRGAPRLLWRLVRIAPFPDLNLVLGFVVYSAYLMAYGYPTFAPLREDRRRIQQVALAAVPQRVVQFESRLVEQCEMHVGN